MSFNLMRKPKKRWGLRIALLLVFLLATLLAVYFYVLNKEVRSRFDSRRWSIPSRIFSATVPVYPGQALGLPEIRRLLEERRYQEAVREPLRAGEYSVSKDSVVVQFREFRFPGRSLPSRRTQFDFRQGKILSIKDPKGDIALLELEPVEVARLFGTRRESRLLVSVSQVPRHLIDAIVSIEDHRFYEHGGIDWFGIMRATWADMRARRVVQGGSTLTQQLVKNYFLEPERNLRRKLLEASMSIVIEASYSKDEILEMYMNEIYMGQYGNVAIHGIGEAARYYFGRNVEDLTFAEAATMAGMIRSPNHYSPLQNQEASLERRNLVLRRMVRLKKLSQPDYERSIEEPLRTPEVILPGNISPYFVDHVGQQLQELYSPDVIQTEGLSIYTTLHPEMAIAAQIAIKEELKSLDADVERSGAVHDSASLQSAMIIIQPGTGAILALVGGKDYTEGPTNRILSTRRQAGPTILPFVCLAALDMFTPATWLPIDQNPEQPRTTLQGRMRNNESFRGKMPMRTALQQLNRQIMSQLAQSTGAPIVADTFRGMGINPGSDDAAALGSGNFDLIPIEIALAYATLNNDGQRPYLLSLREVVTEKGNIQERRTIDFSTVTSPAKAYVVTDLLKGVMEWEVKKSLDPGSPGCQIAGIATRGKVAQDSWFVGYTTDILALVWVGYDDGRMLPPTCGDGAARIWSRFARSIKPWMICQDFRTPPGVIQRIICNVSGRQAVPQCKDTRLEVFLADMPPNEFCTIHGR